MQDEHGGEVPLWACEFIRGMLLICECGEDGKFDAEYVASDADGDPHLFVFVPSAVQVAGEWYETVVYEIDILAIMGCFEQVLTCALQRNEDDGVEYLTATGITGTRLVNCTIQLELAPDVYVDHALVELHHLN